MRNDLERRFVKCNGQFHLLTEIDVAYFKLHQKWPDNYEEVDWDKEVSNFISIKNFLGRTPTKKEAKDAIILADYLHIPVIRKPIDHPKFSTINLYPRYWLEEIFPNNNKIVIEEL